MKEYLPYLVAILTALISYFSARYQSKSDLKHLMHQHALDLESLERKHEMEKEKMQLEYQHQLNMKDKDVGSGFVDTVMKEYLKSPTGQAQMRQMVPSKRQK